MLQVLAPLAVPATAARLAVLVLVAMVALVGRQAQEVRFLPNSEGIGRLVMSEQDVLHNTGDVRFIRSGVAIAYKHRHVEVALQQVRLKQWNADLRTTRALASVLVGLGPADSMTDGQMVDHLPGRWGRFPDDRANGWAIGRAR